MFQLERNLAALQKWTPTTHGVVAAARIPDSFELVHGTDGTQTYLRKTAGELEWLGGTSMPTASAGALVSPLNPGNSNGLGLSMGTGFEWVAFAKRLGGSQALFVCEPDPALVRMALTICDLAELLGSGKIVIFSGEGPAPAAELVEFLASHVGYEAPTVMHPLPTIAAERRNGLLAAGEVMVRAAVQSRHALVGRLGQELAQMEARGTGGRELQTVAMTVGERYSGERPLHRMIGIPELRIDQHGTASLAARLEFLISHYPCRIMSDLFRAELGCVPRSVPVETFVPPLVGPAFWQPGRLVNPATLAADDRVVVHCGVHQQLLESHGIPKSQIGFRALTVSPRVSKHTKNAGLRIAVLGDLPPTDARTLGLELPTHQAVHAAAVEMITADYLAVSFQNAADILRRALLKAGVGAASTDPSLQEPMLRLIRDVLIPAIPLLVLARHLIDQQIPLTLIGDWPNLDRPASELLAFAPLGNFCADPGRWETVAAVLHVSPWGTVSPIILDAVAQQVPVISPRHVSDGFAGSLASIVAASDDVQRPERQQLFAAVKSSLRKRSG